MTEPGRFLTRFIALSDAILDAAFRIFAYFKFLISNSKSSLSFVYFGDTGPRKSSFSSSPDYNTLKVPEDYSLAIGSSLSV